MVRPLQRLCSQFFICDYSDRKSLKNNGKCFLNHLKIYQEISNNMCFKSMFGLLMTSWNSWFIFTYLFQKWLALKENRERENTSIKYLENKKCFFGLNKEYFSWNIKSFVLLKHPNILYCWNNLYEGGSSLRWLEWLI